MGSNALEVAQVNLCTGSMIDMCITSFLCKPIVKTGLSMTQPSTDLLLEILCGCYN